MANHTFSRWLIFLFVLLLSVAHAHAHGQVPSIASAVGYNTHTFSTHNFSSSNVDTAGTYNSGFQWYLFNFMGSTPTPSSLHLNSDGSISVGQGGNTWSAALSSAGRVGTTYVGTAFGGGAYIEAVVKFNAQAFNGLGIGWPGFWANGLLGDLHQSQWAGQAPGYAHYTEVDLLEMFEGVFRAPLNQFHVTLHDWYGPLNNIQQAPAFAFTHDIASQADFSNYHTIAMLWVPATSTTRGYVNFYWDGSMIGGTTYAQFTTQAPPPTGSTPWTFGIIDQDHLVLETGSNNTYPITIKSVDVWQASGANDLPPIMGSPHDLYKTAR